MTPEQFWATVDTSGDCWTWTGHLNPRGYGHVGIGGRIRLAHRVAYEFTYGLIPDGLLVCHHCDNPPCVRPDHLFLGDHRANALDSVQKGRHPSRRRDFTIRGEAQRGAKLTEEAVRSIRRRATEPQKRLAREFGVSDSLIRLVLRRKSWAHVE